MKQHIKSICAAIGYTLVFYGGSWSLRSFLVSWNFIDYLVVIVFFAIMLPLYFFARNRMEKRWTLRGALFLSSALLFCVAWAVTDGGIGDPIFPYFCFLECVHIGILLLDLLGEVFRLLSRKVQTILKPAWLYCTSPNKKTVLAALFYLLLFYVSSVFYIVSQEIFDRFFVLDTRYVPLFCAYIGVQSLLYFSVRKHVERRWPFRGIVLLLWHCFVILHLVVYRFIPVGVQTFPISEQINNFVIYASFMIVTFFLLDLLAERLQASYHRAGP